MPATFRHSDDFLFLEIRHHDIGHLTHVTGNLGFGKRFIQIATFRQETGGGDGKLLIRLQRFAVSGETNDPLPDGAAPEGGPSR